MSRRATLVSGVFLAMCMRVPALDFYSTLNPASTPGNFSGELQLFFSSANSQDYGYNSLYGKDLFHLSAYLSPTHTTASQTANVGLSFVIGPLGNPANDCLICNFPTFFDASIGKTIGYNNLVSPLPSQQTISSLTGTLQAGQPSQNSISYTTGDILYSLNDGIHPPVDTMNFSYSLLVNFDGTDASGTGYWSLTYTGSLTPQATPEPTVGWLAVLGGLVWWNAWPRRRCPAK